MSTVNYDEKTLNELKKAINKALKSGLQSFKVKDYPGYVEFEDPPEHYIDYVNGALMNRIEKYNKEDLEDSKDVLNNIKLAVIDPDLSDFLTDKGNTWAGFTLPDGEYPVVMKNRYRGLNTFLHEFRHNIDNIIDLTDELQNYLDNAYPEIKDIEKPVVNATLRGKIIGELATSEGKYFKEIGLNLDKLDKYILSAGKEQIFNTLLHLDSEGSKYAKYLENKFGSVKNIPEYIFLNMRDAMIYVPLYEKDPFGLYLQNKLIRRNKDGGSVLYFKGGNKVSKEKTYTKKLFLDAVRKYILDKGYDLYEVKDGTDYWSKFYDDKFYDYVGYKYDTYRRLATLEDLDRFLKIYVDDLFDAEFENTFDSLDNLRFRGPNILPNLNVNAYPVISLYTYPFGNSKFPLSHSAINGPVKDLSGLWFAISRPPGSKDYNYFYNNCSDSTAAFLEDVFGIQIPRGVGNITTPQLVREEVLKQIPGVREEVRPDGSIRTLIPTDINSYRYYWNNLNAPHYLNLKDDGQRSIPHEENINSQPRKLIDSPINKDYKSKEIKYDSKLITAKRGNKLIKTRSSYVVF